MTLNLLSQRACSGRCSRCPCCEPAQRYLSATIVAAPVHIAVHPGGQTFQDVQLVRATRSVRRRPRRHAVRPAARPRPRPSRRRWRRGARGGAGCGGGGRRAVPPPCPYSGCRRRRSRPWGRPCWQGWSGAAPRWRTPGRSRPIGAAGTVGGESMLVKPSASLSTRGSILLSMSLLWATAVVAAGPLLPTPVRPPCMRFWPVKPPIPHVVVSRAALRPVSQVDMRIQACWRGWKSVGQHWWSPHRQCWCNQYSFEV